MLAAIKDASARSWLGIAYAVIVGAVLAFARFWPSSLDLLPACPFRTLTHWPCPFCRGGRALYALARAEVERAAQLNPLVVVGVGLLLLWAFSDVVTLLSGKEVRVQLSDRESRGIRFVAVGLVVLNWAYLVLSEAVG